MDKWVIKTLPVRKLVLSPSPLRDEVQVARLMFAFRSAPDVFLSRLLEAITPVPVLTFHRHYYPVRHLAELAVLALYYPEQRLPIVVKGRAKSLAQIQQQSASAQWIDLLHSHHCLDLGGLEVEWQQAFGYPPIFAQKDLCRLLGCERTTLYKHHQKVKSRWHAGEEELVASPSPVDLTALIAHIPDE
ncbi:hypothetical protein MD588_05420 [Photobacterium sp. SDRW27]|uniref:hypothetical protein n=1 Tax=Photobacterium obscurum TaxID=2829490 RepID=UPI002243CFC2|nr:hypothetical protein [Photobacterium obscurum]MCW8328243.1 hypothetical protein [Photobacterium obscurum]